SEGSDGSWGVNEPQLTDFRARLLTLRGRAGVSQREVAARLGVHVRSVQAWETGISYPGAASLRRLIALYVERGTFPAGGEAAAAAGLWAAALGEAPRLKEPFDDAGFATLSAAAGPPDAAPGRAAAAGPAAAAPGRAAAADRGTGAAVSAAVRPPAPAAADRDWGEAPGAGALHGRAPELETLTRRVVGDGCRGVAGLGRGGIGKPAAAARRAGALAPRFDAVYWRSLRRAPPCADWLAGAVLSLSRQRTVPADGEEARRRQLLALLRARRALLVL